MAVDHRDMEQNNNNYQYGMKSTFAQCYAIVGACFVQIGIGCQIMLPTIIIGSLEKNEFANGTNESNRDEFLIMSTKQASWFGSLLYLCTPLGSLVSSILLRRIGHKRCLILSNVPYLASIVLLYHANDIETLYLCSVITGLTMGFVGGPSSSYLSEVCEPKLRGALTSATNVFYFAGVLMVTVIYAMTLQWRYTVLVTTIVPVLNIIVLLVTPDSPIWLITRGKTNKAQQTLGKLRGWVSHEKCVHEFHEMVIYTTKETVDGNDQDSINNVWQQLVQPEVIKPFRLLVIYFFFSNLLSGVPYSPYLTAVFINFGAPVDVNWTIAFSVILGAFGGIMTIFSVRILGKRFLTLSTLMICSVCYISIGLIGLHCESLNPVKSWTILVLFLIATLAASFGIMPIGWVLLGEVFPIKTKNITCSVCSVLSFIITFFFTKFYLDFENLVGFYNTFTLFGVGGLIGFVYFYFFLPETENKTLKEIEEFFK
ncbi:facilitated trehalose transporter Tret1-like [Adelges cooleyi]|uniref:facilitated trehalose transporter Tret1-like n=1 Tax=Adelges cooleyi TaxID=133065 RepID=UPI0021804AF5|nr:facilitated trehalose transporter Tret1-like [Adelges cooleyi]